MDFQTCKILITEDLANELEERGVREEDLREVIVFAEASGEKLCLEGEPHYLARKRIGNFSAYAEYIVREDTVELVDAYSHMVAFQDEQQGGTDNE